MLFSVLSLMLSISVAPWHFPLVLSISVVLWSFPVFLFSERPWFFPVFLDLFQLPLAISIPPSPNALNLFPSPPFYDCPWPFPASLAFRPASLDIHASNPWSFSSIPWIWCYPLLLALDVVPLCCPMVLSLVVIQWCCPLLLFIGITPAVIHWCCPLI